MEEQATLAELDAEAGRIADSAYSADFDAEPPIKDLVRRAVLMERERCARVCETTPAEAFCTVMHQGQLQRARETFAAAIRSGDRS